MEAEETRILRMDDVYSCQRDWGPIVHCKPVLTPDSRYLLVTSGKTVKVISTETGNLIEEHLHHEYKVIGVLPAEGKQKYITCDENGSVCVWKLHKKGQGTKYPIKITEHLKKNAKVISFEYCRQRQYLFLLVQTSQRETGTVLKYVQPYHKQIPSILAKSVQLGSNKMAVSKSGAHLAYLTAKGLTIKTDFEWIRHLVGTRNLTCVAFHPSHDVIATGDNTGRVVLWYEFTSRTPKQLVLHWHTLPLADLAFSCSGNELLTGGGESVLVKWQLTKEERYFLPRVGMPIKYISTDEQNKIIALAHSDNAITLINSQSHKLERVILGFSMDVENPNPFQAGIEYDPRTRAVVTNGKSGHVQFYDIHHGKQLYHLDITLSNYYCQERNEEIHNTEVQHIAISPSGHQMATVEFRDDGKTALELRLKFWSFKVKDQEWHLNTSVEMPHQKAVTGLLFQPAPDNATVCVSCSEEGKFKIWEEIDASDIYGTKSIWTCRSAGFYRHLPVMTISFSPDASLLAAAFNNILTFWDPMSCQLKGTLSQPYLPENIIQVEFGRGEGCRSLVVTRNQVWLCVWDLLTCSLQWRVSIHSTCLASDPLSPYMAIFSEDCNLFIFDPRRSKVVSLQRKINTAPPLSAAFIPRVQKAESTSFWNSHSSLLYISHDQTLHTLEVGTDLNSANERIAGQVTQLVQESQGPPPPSTPFAALLAPVHTSHAKQPKEKPKGSVEFGVQLEKSTGFIQKVLNDTRVYRLDSFAELSTEFSKLVIPGPETSKDKENKIEFEIKIKEKEKSAKKKRSTSKKKKKKDLQRIVETDFSSLISVLSL